MHKNRLTCHATLNVGVKEGGDRHLLFAGNTEDHHHMAM